MAFVLDVRRLRVLLAVAEQGGVAAAARSLSFTPPAVSQQLAALERQLDVALVDRSRRTARLTPAGHRLADHARQVLAGLEAAEADLANLDGGIRGVLRVGTIPTLGQTVLPRVLADVTAFAPDLDFRVEQLEPEDSLPAVARGELDVALAGEYGLTPRRRQANVDRIDLFSEPIYIAVPADSAFTGPQVHVGDLRDARWIAPDPGSSCAVLLERSCAIAGYEPHIIGHCADFAVATGLVRTGLGVALVPRIAVPAEDPAGPQTLRLLTAVDPTIHRTLYVAVRPGSRDHPAIAALLTALQAAAAGMLPGA